LYYYDGREKLQNQITAAHSKSAAVWFLKLLDHFLLFGTPINKIAKRAAVLSSSTISYGIRTDKIELKNPAIIIIFMDFRQLQKKCTEQIYSSNEHNKLLL
jgi:hypothetical protein